MGLKGRKIGIRSENLVKEACLELKYDGKIIDFERKDERGSDFLIYCLDSKIIKIEVKSSHYGKFIHEIRYTTPVIIASGERKTLALRKKRKILESIKKKILEIV